MELSSDNTKILTLTGTPFQIVSIDGNDINKPTNPVNTQLKLGVGGRYDLMFTMPDKPVLLSEIDVFSGEKTEAGMLLTPNNKEEVPTVPNNMPEFEPEEYGSPKLGPFSPKSNFDQEFMLVIDNKFGFYNGKWNILWATNGKLFPHTPMLMVQEGDLVKVTFMNRSGVNHPMYLHRHHLLALSRNGKPVMGKPLVDRYPKC